MNVNLKGIQGPWQEGWVLDKHSLKSERVGYYDNGRPRFDTTRTEAGEATYQLKYGANWAQAEVLATAIAEHIVKRLPEPIGFIVPMPASNHRAKQPVSEVAKALGKIINVPCFENTLVKAPTGVSLKDLHTRAEKEEALSNKIQLQDAITNEGKWNVLLVDDLYDSGASMDTACGVLRTYAKVANIYVAALTWK